MLRTVESATRRSRRRCDKHNLHLNCDQQDLIPNSDAYPITPITPPAAFLSLGYKRSSSSSAKGKGEKMKKRIKNSRETRWNSRENRKTPTFICPTGWRTCGRPAMTNVLSMSKNKFNFVSRIWFGRARREFTSNKQQTSNSHLDYSHSLFASPTLFTALPFECLILPFNVDALRMIFPWTRNYILFALRAHVHLWPARRESNHIPITMNLVESVCVCLRTNVFTWKSELKQIHPLHFVHRSKFALEYIMVAWPTVETYYLRMHNDDIHPDLV